MAIVLRKIAILLEHGNFGYSSTGIINLAIVLRNIAILAGTRSPTENCNLAIVLRKTAILIEFCKLLTPVGRGPGPIQKQRQFYPALRRFYPALRQFHPAIFGVSLAVKFKVFSGLNALNSCIVS